MPVLPCVSGRICVTALQKIGYICVRQRGSHIRLHHVTRQPVTVPLHKTLDRGTLKSILRTADLSVDEFTRLTKNL
ncbi:MAG: type II toxin-antitoxin system HicA family toxin [Myxococcota bacterium]